MKFKNVFLISIILLAIFSVGVVCAENVTDGTGNSTNGTVPVNGTNGTVPVNGTNGTVPVNGTNGTVLLMVLCLLINHI